MRKTKTGWLLTPREWEEIEGVMLVNRAVAKCGPLTTEVYCWPADPRKWRRAHIVTAVWAEYSGPVVFARVLEGPLQGKVVYHSLATQEFEKLVSQAKELLEKEGRGT